MQSDCPAIFNGWRAFLGAPRFGYRGIGTILVGSSSTAKRGACVCLDVAGNPATFPNLDVENRLYRGIGTTEVGSSSTPKRGACVWIASEM
jgi:hypothetical protein